MKTFEHYENKTSNDTCASSAQLRLGEWRCVQSHILSFFQEFSNSQILIALNLGRWKNRTCTRGRKANIALRHRKGCLLNRSGWTWTVRTKLIEIQADERQVSSIISSWWNNERSWIWRNHHQFVFSKKIIAWIISPGVSAYCRYCQMFSDQPTISLRHITVQLTVKERKI